MMETVVDYNLFSVLQSKNKKLYPKPCKRKG